MQMGLTARMRHLPVAALGRPAAARRDRARAGRRARSCCSPTSRPATSTRDGVAPGAGPAREDQRRAATTIVMVTHDPELAARARRKLHVLDGRLIDPHAAGGPTPSTRPRPCRDRAALQPAPGRQEPPARPLVHARHGAEPGAQRQHLRHRADHGAALLEHDRPGAPRRVPRRGRAQRRAARASTGARSSRAWASSPRNYVSVPTVRALAATGLATASDGQLRLGDDRRARRAPARAACRCASATPTSSRCSTSTSATAVRSRAPTSARRRPAPRRGAVGHAEPSGSTAAPTASGRTIRIAGRDFRVVGVMRQRAGKMNLWDLRRRAREHRQRAGAVRVRRRAAPGALDLAGRRSRPSAAGARIAALDERRHRVLGPPAAGRGADAIRRGADRHRPAAGRSAPADEIVPALLEARPRPTACS